MLPRIFPKMIVRQIRLIKIFKTSQAFNPLRNFHLMKIIQKKLISMNWINILKKKRVKLMIILKVFLLKKSSNRNNILKTINKIILMITLIILRKILKICFLINAQLLKPYSIASANCISCNDIAVFKISSSELFLNSLRYLKVSSGPDK